MSQCVSIDGRPRARQRRLALLAVTSAVLVLPVSLAAGGVGAAASVGHAAAHPKTQKGEIDVVQTVGGSKDLWVITDQSNGDYNVARQHKGTWQTLPPTLAHDTGQLFAITAPDAHDVWVSGEVYPDGPEEPVIYRWNGTSLVSQDLPTLVVKQRTNPAIASISAVSAKDGWAVSNGLFSGRDSDGHPTGPVALHWTGHAWGAVSTPVPFTSVVDIKRGNAWAVGGYHDIYHWNGHKWKLNFTVPAADEISDINASSAHSVVAVGDDNAQAGDDDDPSNGTYIVRYDGKKWSPMSVTPKLKTPVYFSQVTVVGRSAWAIASVPDSAGQASSIFHSSGGAWKVQQTHGGENNIYLADISASSTKRVFAAGNSGGADVGGSPTYLEQYNGHHWKQIASKF